MNFFDILFMQQTGKIKPDADFFDVLFASVTGTVEKLVTIVGNPLSFISKRAQTAKSTKVTLEPIQDLHGYGNPWPAGGGKNRFDKDSPNILTNQRIAVSTGGTYASNGYSVSDYIPIELTERFSLTISSGFTSYYAGYDANKQYISTPTNTWNSGSSKILSAAGYAYVRFDFKTSDIDTVQFEKGYASAYAPYSNICPISGRTGVSLNGCSKNQFNKDDSSSIINAVVPSGSSGTISASSNSRLVFIRCKPNTTYTVSKTAGARFRVATTVDIPAVGVACSQTISNNTAGSITIITNATAKYLCSYIYNTTVDSGTAEAMIASVQIEEGPTATTYESYQQSNNITITFPALGKNLYPFPYTEKFGLSGSGNNRTIINSQNNQASIIRLEPNTNYYLSGDRTEASDKYARLATFSSYPKVGDVSIRFLSYPRNNGLTFTTSDDELWALVLSTSGYSEDCQMQLEIGSSSTAYVPYTNTCYGGILDVETGVLTVDTTIVTIKNYNWVYDTSSGGFFKYAFSSKKRNDDYMISTVLKYSSVTASNMPPYSMKQGASSYPTRIIIKMPSDVTTQNQLFELIGDEKIVFNLNDPTTITITPEQIQILKGQNNIWIKDGEATMELTYKA